MIPKIDSDFDLQQLTQVGNYKIIRQLGAGGMGVVFEAEDITLHRRVALKVLKSNNLEQIGKERFLLEARATAQINHDHVVTIYQVGEERGLLYIIMQLLEGETLEGYLEKNAIPPIRETIRIGMEIAEGLAAAHNKKLIHRDIKPANIWLEGSRRRVKVLDFGLARRTDINQNLTQTGFILGTPAFMSPEHARGDQLDHRSDLFSLGCILYLMTTGNRPFGGANIMAIIRNLELFHPQPPSRLNLLVPQELSDLIMQLLAKDKVSRPDSTDQVVDQLETMLQSIPANSSSANSLNLQGNPGSNPNFSRPGTTISYPSQQELNTPSPGSGDTAPNRFSPFPGIEQDTANQSNFPGITGAVQPGVHSGGQIPSGTGAMITPPPGSNIAPANVPFGHFSPPPHGSQDGVIPSSAAPLSSPVAKNPLFNANSPATFNNNLSSEAFPSSAVNVPAFPPKFPTIQTGMISGQAPISNAPANLIPPTNNSNQPIGQREPSEHHSTASRGRSLVLLLFFCVLFAGGAYYWYKSQGLDNPMGDLVIDATEDNDAEITIQQIGGSIKRMSKNDRSFQLFARQ